MYVYGAPLVNSEITELASLNSGYVPVEGSVKVYTKQQAIAQIAVIKA